MSELCNSMFRVAARLDDVETLDSPSPYRAILDPAHYVCNAPQFAETLKTALMVGYGNSPLVIDGENVHTFAVALNTALDLGNDAIKLSARLHGQCEIHTWVEGPNRKWLAEIIQAGLKRGIFRGGMGWDSVIELLESRDDEPVVTSYSVCDRFPNSHTAKWKPPIVDDEPDYDKWYDLPLQEQWQLAMAGIRDYATLEMKPEGWDEYCFGDGMNGFELYRAAVDAAATTARAAPAGEKEEES